MKTMTAPVRIACAALLLLSASAAMAEETKFTGDVGLGVTHSQAIIRGADSSTGPLPYFAFDYGRLFARIDTFGVRTLAFGKGHLEVIGRYRGDAYQVSGLTQRGTPLLLGLSTLQVSSIGAFEVNLLRDFGASAGTIAQARYIGKIPVGRVSFYPELGVEVLDARYANYYYGTRGQDVATLGQSYNPGSAINPFLGVMAIVKITDHWSLNTYLRRTVLDETITRSPLVNKSGRNSMFVAASRSF